jgi:hypothetical protein
MVLLAGDQAEEQMWTSLAQRDADLCETVIGCVRWSGFLDCCE